MSGDTEGKKILIVDDEEIIVDILKRRFGRMGFSVHSAFNGDDAISLLQKEHIDLTICDVLMPTGASGEAVLQAAQKSNPGSRFVAISGNIMADDSVRKLMQQGADLFIKKPFPSLGDVARQVAELIS